MKYTISPYQQARLDDWHYHRSDVDQQERFEKINNATRDLAKLLMECCPPGRNLSIAITDLETVRMRANSAIVLDEGKEE